jgi:hypothetical protein
VSCVSLLVLVAEARLGEAETSLEAEAGSTHGYIAMPRVVGI